MLPSRPRDEVDNGDLRGVDLRDEEMVDELERRGADAKPRSDVVVRPRRSEDNADTGRSFAGDFVRRRRRFFNSESDRSEF